jgi:YesN/AraC family two-component response regulator
MSFDNGREALAYLNGGSGDIMLLDWRMPELTGIDCCGKCATLASAFQSSF